jgi:hypothetical protein
MKRSSVMIKVDGSWSKQYRFIKHDKCNRVHGCEKVILPMEFLHRWIMYHRVPGIWYSMIEISHRIDG